MKITTAILCTAAAALFSSAALAHPEGQPTSQENKQESKPVKKQIKIIKLDKDGQLNEVDLLNGVDIDALNEMGIDIKKILSEDFDGQNGDTGGDTGEGQTRVIIQKENAQHLAGEPRSADDHKANMHKKVWIEKHAARQNDQDVKVIVKHIGPDHSDNKPIKVDRNVNVFVGEDGNVSILRDGQPVSASDENIRVLNIEKDVEKTDGKIKTRIVIEIEEDE